MSELTRDTLDSKVYRAVHTLTIDVTDEASLFDNETGIDSQPFFCPDDPFAPTFIINVGFGNESDDCVSVNFRIFAGKAYVKYMEIFIYGNQWSDQLHRDDIEEPLHMSSSEECVGKIEYRSSTDWGYWEDFRQDFETLNDIRIVIEIDYQHPTIELEKTSKDQFREAFGQLFGDADGADVTFVVKNEKILAHKLILVTRSPYFKNMFKSGMEESVSKEVKIGDIEPKVFRELLKFVYCDTPPEFHAEVSPELLIAAEKYGLDSLKKICESSLIENLSADNVVDFLLLAETHNCPDLLEKAAAVFRFNFVSLAKEGKLQQLEASPTLLTKLLKFHHMATFKDRE